MKVGQKVYLVATDNTITDAVIEKITRSLITLDNGVILHNQQTWRYDISIYYYSSKLDGYEVVETKTDAERLVKNRIFGRFDVYSYRNIKYPTKPSTPRMSSTSPTKDEIVRYQNAMEAFETQMKVFTDETAIANNKMKEWMDTYYAFLAYRDGLEDYSEEIRSAVYAMAYDAGHSSGYGEVANYHITFAEFAIKVIELSKK